MKSCFITVEGIEGVGKSTNIQFITDWLTERAIPFIVTREPGGTVLGEQLRELLLHGDSVDGKAELLMMFASRAQHLAEKIKPALAAGTWVVCDRFTDSTFAYQGGGRGLNLDWIEQLAQLIHGDFQADLTLLLDAPVEVGRARAAKRSASDRIEAESLNFFNRVRDQFLQRAQDHKRFTVINANQALEQVQCEVEAALDSLLNKVKGL